ncbi:hypothetical protein V1264_010643 [Littorina saxatilis]|uniref:WxxW domain-containing protein n=1 Tax=Littorina saxatilis TaxID=31220 RepID=A0AAN9G0Z6_9CAEN
MEVSSRRRGLANVPKYRKCLENGITGLHNTEFFVCFVCTGSETDGAQWTQWFNSDSPRDGEGDFETTDSIKKTDKICRYGQAVVQSQCRLAGTNDSFDFTTTAFVNDRLLQACSSYGLICLNTQQASGLCEDYEVRFLCKNPNADSSSNDSLFPNFDFKIYIILALVPLVIVSLRIIWSCCCKERLKRNRQRRDQRMSIVSSRTLSTNSSQASFDSALANPPPAYTDLFGSVRSGGVFVISDGNCVACGKCMHHGDASYPGRLGSVSGPSELNGRLNSVSVPSVVIVEGGRVGASSTVHAAVNEDEVFENSDSHVTAATTTSANAVTSQQQAANIVNTRMSISSVSSVLGAVGLPASSIPARAPPGASCACACHGKQSGHMNLAFHWESNDQVNSPTPVVYPGMHKPAFSFSRMNSVTSFTSFTSFTEPPDYEEALEILKKETPDSDHQDDDKEETKVAV